MSNKTDNAAEYERSREIKRAIIESRKEDEADARLIAAAPDLLAACEAALDAIDNLITLDADLDAAGQDNDATWDQLRAAIARAKGGQ